VGVDFEDFEDSVLGSVLGSAPGSELVAQWPCVASF